jgi:hypothetical protein
MTKTTKSSRLHVTTGVKAGGLGMNHTRATLKVRTSVKAGGLANTNHTRGLLAA